VWLLPRVFARYTCVNAHADGVARWSQPRCWWCSKSTRSKHATGAGAGARLVPAVGSGGGGATLSNSSACTLTGPFPGSVWVAAEDVPLGSRQNLVIPRSIIRSERASERPRVDHVYAYVALSTLIAVGWLPACRQMPMKPPASTRRSSRKIKR